jgi:DNA-binding CsgD family transcriptional regulator
MGSGDAREGVAERRVLGGLPTLLATLGARPHPDEVITTVVTGPAGRMGATAGILLVVEGRTLRLIGSHGYTVEELAGFEVIPLDADLPIAEAARQGEPIASGSTVAVAEYSGLQREADRWADLRGRRRYGSIVSVPIVAQGITVGAYGFTCSDDRAWTTQEIAMLEAVGTSLALWFAHPDSGLVDAGGRSPAAGGGAPAPRLTDRQVAILELAAQGRTTAAIARALGYSESTVKHDLRRALLALDCPDRACVLARARELGLLPAGGA